MRDSHETSILYSLNIISANCLQKTKSILAGIVDDMRLAKVGQLRYMNDALIVR